MCILREAILQEKCSFFNIVQKAFDPPPHLFEHYVANFSEAILTKVRLLQQLLTKQHVNLQ